MSEFPCPQCSAPIDTSRPGAGGGFTCAGCGFSMTPARGAGGPAAPPELPAEWELLGKLGEGGMGAVYRARHRMTHREVAIKCVTAGHGGDEEYLRRFEREVVVLDRLEHPNVVRLVHAGIHQGRPYLGGTSPVGSYPGGASPFGCLDMAGNVLQWCSDFYHDSYYSHAVDHDPKGPDQGAVRIYRGSSWYFIPKYLRASNRFPEVPSKRDNGLGFRVVSGAQEN